MTSEQAFRYATRSLSIFCVISALCALAYLPPDALDAAHYWHISQISDLPAGALSSATYFFRVYLLRSACLVLQAAAFLLVAMWLYRGGKGLQRYFEPNSSESNNG